jgi:hypothetical protein
METVSVELTIDLSVAGSSRASPDALASVPSLGPGGGRDPPACPLRALAAAKGAAKRRGGCGPGLDTRGPWRE